MRDNAEGNRPAVTVLAYTGAIAGYTPISSF